MPTDVATDDTDAIKRLALVSMTLFQPNVLISQSLIEKISQFSLFNANLKLGAAIPKKDALNEFDDTIFTTKPGRVNQFGIQPPLISFKEHLLPTGNKDIDLSAKRPIVICFNHRVFDKVLKICQIADVLSTDSKPAKTEPVYPPIDKSAHKIRSLRRSLFNANRIDVSLGSIDLQCECPTSKYSVRFGVDSTNARITFTDRPHCLRFDGCVRSMMMWAGSGVVLHPLSLQVKGRLTKQVWKRVPLLEANVQSGFVDMCLGPENLRNLSVAQKVFASKAASFQAKLMEGKGASSEIGAQCERLMREAELMPIATPSLSDTTTTAQECVGDQGEYYQDDLR